MEALGTLTGGIAHDFNNILAAIIGFTELVEGHVQKGAGGTSPEEGHGIFLAGPGPGAPDASLTAEGRAGEETPELGQHRQGDRHAYTATTPRRSASGSTLE